MKKAIHRAGTRGHSYHGWLDSYHTFSFADYHDPERIHFGALRVLNDDTVAGGEGFGAHPHDNMEIVSIPLEGELRHQDSMGHTSVLRTGEIQVMTAGTGIIHSEFNNSPDRPVKFLQIWVFPDRRGLPTRYEEITLAPARTNELRTIVAPEGNGSEHTAWIHQSAWFHTLNLEKDTYEYAMRREGNGLYVFVLEGDVTVENEKLASRDGMGIWEQNDITLHTDGKASLLLIEVPMR